MTKIDLSRKIDVPGWVEALMKPTKIGSGHLERQWEEIGDEVLEAMKKVLPTGKYTMGPALKKFEREFAVFSDCKYAVGISSGTQALHLALEAMEVGPGDEVITVCNTYVATAFAASYCGATPVFVDIDPKTFNMTAELVGSQDHTQDQGYRSGASLRPRGGHGSHHGVSQETQPVGAGRRLPRTRRYLQGPPGRLAGRRGRLFFLPRQEHGRLR